MRDKCLWIHIIQKYRYTKFHENRMHTYRMVALNWTNEQHSQGVLVSPHRGVNIRSYDLIWSLLFWIQHKEALLDQLTKKLHFHMIYEKNVSINIIVHTGETPFHCRNMTFSQISVYSNITVTTHFASFFWKYGNMVKNTEIDVIDYWNCWIGVDSSDYILVERKCPWNYMKCPWNVWKFPQMSLKLFSRGWQLYFSHLAFNIIQFYQANEEC